MRLLHWQLNLRQPITYRFFVPDTVDVAFSCKTCHLISVFFGVLHDISIRFTDVIVSPFVVDA